MLCVVPATLRRKVPCNMCDQRRFRSARAFEYSGQNHRCPSVAFANPWLFTVQRVKVRMRLSRCIGESEPILGAPDRRTIFSWCGPLNTTLPCLHGFCLFMLQAAARQRRSQSSVEGTWDIRYTKTWIRGMLFIISYAIYFWHVILEFQYKTENVATVNFRIKGMMRDRDICLGMRFGLAHVTAYTVIELTVKVWCDMEVWAHVTPLSITSAGILSPLY